MNAHRYSACQAAVLQFIRNAQLIQAMPCLMDDAVERGEQIVLMIVRGDAHIFVVKIGGEGMFALAQNAALGVHFHHRHDALCQLLLQSGRICTLQPAGIRLPGFADGTHKGHKLTAKAAEVFIQVALIDARLKIIQHYVIRLLSAVPVAGKTPSGRNQIFQAGAEGVETIVHFGVMPHGSRLVDQLGVGYHLLHRNAGGVLILAAHFLRLAPGLGVQLGAAFMQRLQQVAHPVIDEQLVAHPGQGAHRFSPALVRQAGSGGFRIIAEHAQRVLEYMQLALQVFQVFYQCFYIHHSLLLYSDYSTQSANLVQCGHKSGKETRYFV